MKKLLTISILLAYCLSLSAQIEQKITAGDAAIDDIFGNQVDISGNTAVVGARHDDDLGNNSGSAYIFTKSGPQWIQTQKLLASDGAIDDQFGWPVAIYDNFIAVSARNDDDKGGNSGSVYIFEFNGLNWVQLQKLTASDGNAEDKFGFSIEFSGDKLIIGSPLKDTPSNNEGAAYLFEYNDAFWIEKQILTASNSNPDDRFGFNVSISEDIIAVGAQYGDDLVSNSGTVSIFALDDSSWIETQKISASDAAIFDGFGRNLKIENQQLLISAPYNDDNGNRSGAAYIFSFIDTSWIETQKLLPFNNSAGDEFGTWIDVSGDIAIISAQYADLQNTDDGVAYLFKNANNSWVQIGMLSASDANAYDRFGVCAGIDDHIAIIGAPNNDDNGANSGSAYLVNLLNPLNDSCNNAVMLTCGDTIFGTTSFATHVDAPDTCAINLSTAPGIWYTFTGNGDNVTASLCGSDFDTQIGVFINACDPVTSFCIAGNDDVCGLQSEAVFPTLPGFQYYIYVTGFDTFTGEFQLALNCSPPSCGSAPMASTDQVGLSSARVNWTPVAGAVSYQILGGEIATPQTAFTIPGNIHQLVVNGLGPGVTYTWRVRAVCNFSGTALSPYSSTQAFSTLISCDPPTSISAGPITSNTVRLNWTANPFGSGYKIYGNIVGNPNPVKLSVSDPNADHFDVLNLAPNTSYYWTIITLCGQDVSAIGVVDTFTTATSTLSEKLNEDNKEYESVSIYPNPASDQFSMYYAGIEANSSIHIELIDLNGRCVFKKKIQTQNNSVHVKLSDELMNGVYQVVVSSDEVRHVSKLILMR